MRRSLAELCLKEAFMFSTELWVTRVFDSVRFQHTMDMDRKVELMIHFTH